MTVKEMTTNNIFGKDDVSPVSILNKSIIYRGPVINADAEAELAKIQKAWEDQQEKKQFDQDVFNNAFIQDLNKSMLSFFSPVASMEPEKIAAEEAELQNMLEQENYVAGDKVQRFERSQDYLTWNETELAEHMFGSKVGVEYKNRVIAGTYLSGGTDYNDSMNSSALMDRDYFNEYMEMTSTASDLANAYLQYMYYDKYEQKKAELTQMYAQQAGQTNWALEKSVKKSLNKWYYDVLEQIKELVKNQVVIPFYEGHSYRNPGILNKRMQERIEVLNEQTLRPEDPNDPLYNPDNEIYESNIHGQLTPEENLRRNKEFNERQRVINYQRAYGEIYGMVMRNRNKAAEALDKAGEESDAESVTNILEAVVNFKELTRNYSPIWNSVAWDPENEYNKKISTDRWIDMMFDFNADMIIYGTEKAVENLDKHVRNAIADRDTAIGFFKSEDYEGPWYSVNWSAAGRNIKNTVKGFAASFVAAAVEDVESLTGLLPSFVNAVAGEINGAYQDDGMNIFQKTMQNIMEDRYGMIQLISQEDTLGGLLSIIPDKASANLALDPERYSIMDWASGLQITGAWSEKRQKEMRAMGMSYLAPMTSSDAGRVINSNFGMQLFTNMGFMVEMLIGGWAKTTSLLKVVNTVGKARIGWRAARVNTLVNKMNGLKSAQVALRKQTQAEIQMLAKQVEKIHKQVRTGRRAVAIAEPTLASHAEAVIEAKTTYDELIEKGVRDITGGVTNAVLQQSNISFLSEYGKVSFFGNMPLQEGEKQLVQENGRTVMKQTYVDENGKVYTEKEATKKFGEKKEYMADRNGNTFTEKEARERAFNMAYAGIAGSDGKNFDKMLQKVVTDASIASTYDYMLNLVLLSIDNGVLGTSMQTRFYKNWLKTSRFGKVGFKLPGWLTARPEIKVNMPFRGKPVFEGVTRSSLFAVLRESTVQGFEEGMQRLFSEGAKASAFYNMTQYMQNIINGDAPEHLGTVYGDTFYKGLYTVGKQFTTPEFWNEWILGQASYFLMPFGGARSTTRYNEATGRIESVIFGRGSEMIEVQKKNGRGELLYYDAQGNETTEKTDRPVMERKAGKKESIREMLYRLSPLQIGAINTVRQVRAENEHMEAVVKALNEWAEDPKNVDRLNDVVAMMNSMTALEQIAGQHSGDDEAYTNNELAAVVTIGMVLEKVSDTKHGRAMLDYLLALSKMEGQVDEDGNFSGDETATKVLKQMRNAMQQKTDQLGVTKDMSDKEIFDQVKHNAEQMLEIIKEVGDESSAIDQELGQIDTDVKKALIHNKIQRKRMKERLIGENGVLARISEAIASLDDFDVKGTARMTGRSESEVRAIIEYGSIASAKKRRAHIIEERDKLKKELEAPVEQKTEENTGNKKNVDKKYAAKQKARKKRLEQERKDKETVLNTLNRLIAREEWIDEIEYDESKKEADKPLTLSEILTLDAETRGKLVASALRKRAEITEFQKSRDRKIAEFRKAKQGRGKWKFGKKYKTAQAKEKEINNLLNTEYAESNKPVMSETELLAERAIERMQAVNSSIAKDMVNAGRLTAWIRESDRDYTEAMRDPQSFALTVNNIRRNAADRQMERLAEKLETQHPTYEGLIMYYKQQQYFLDSEKLTLLRKKLLAYETKLPEKRRFFTQYTQLVEQGARVLMELQNMYKKGGDELVMATGITNNDAARIRAVIGYCINKGIKILDEGGKLTENVVKLIENPPADFSHYFKQEAKVSFDKNHVFKLMTFIRTQYNGKIEENEKTAKEQDTKPGRVRRDPKKPYVRPNTQRTALTSRDPIMSSEKEKEIKSLFSQQDKSKLDALDKKGQKAIENALLAIAGKTESMREIIERFVRIVRYTVETNEALSDKDKIKELFGLNANMVSDAVQHVFETFLEKLKNSKDISPLNSQNLKNLWNTYVDDLYSQNTTSFKDCLKRCFKNCLENANLMGNQSNYSLATVEMKETSQMQNVANTAINDHAFIVNLLTTTADFNQEYGLKNKVMFDLLQSEQNYEGVLNDKYKEWGIEKACRNLQRSLANEAKNGKKTKRKVYFVVSNSLSAAVKDQMDKKAREDMYKYSESRDMPVIAVVEDDEGPLEVVVNSIKTKVQPIGFLATASNRLEEGDETAAKVLRNSARKNRPDDDSDLYVITDDVVVDDEGKKESQPVTSFLYAVWDKNMDDMYRNVTSNDEGAFVVWDQNREHNAYNLLLRLAKGYILNNGYKGYDALKKLNKYSTKQLEKALDDIVTGTDQRTFWSIVKNAKDPMSILIKFFCDKLSAFNRDANNVGLQYDNIDIFVLSMMQTYSSDGKTRWVDVLKNGNFKEIAAFNTTTAMFCRTLYDYVYGDNGLIQQLKNAADDAKRENIVDYWMHKDKRYLENALNAHIHLADQRHYNITYDATSHKVRISIDVGSGTDSKVVTLFETNIDNDIPDTKQAPIVQTQIGGQFLKNLLYNEAGGLNMTQDASGSNRDYCIAHWQLDYQNFDHENGRYYNGSENEKNAIRERMMRLVTDGLIYMRTYDLRPSTPTPAIANPVDSNNDIRSFERTNLLIDTLEKWQEKKEGEKGKKSKTPETVTDDVINNNQTVKNVNDAVEFLAKLDKEAEQHISKKSMMLDSKDKSTHLSVTAAVMGAKEASGIKPYNAELVPEDGQLTKSDISKKIGTGIDGFFRAIVLGQCKSSTPDLTKFCPNYSHEVLVELAESFEKFLTDAKRIYKVEKFVNGSRLFDKVFMEKNGVKEKINLSGELDLIGVRADGSLVLFDFKTMRHYPIMQTAKDNSKYYQRNMMKYGIQLSLYRTMLEQKGFKVDDTLHVIPISTFYKDPQYAGGNVRFFANQKDQYDSQLYNENNQRIYLDSNYYGGEPRIGEIEDLSFVDCGTENNPLIYDQFTEDAKRVIDNNLNNPTDVLTIDKGDDGIPQKKDEPTPQATPIDTKAEGLEKPEETYTPSPEPTPPAQPVQTKKETFPDSVKETFMKNGYEWMDIEEEVKERESEKAESILASLKSCCKKQLELNDNVSDDEFAKIFKKKISENEEEEVDEMKEQILRCAQGS